ncbi:MAG: DMT family transporter [Pseudomonadales bacterium]|nr:DMT family transporter [Pseudomonadales bacterium]MBO7007368.1 DMT family transporter [Pseudomonadales bacterium]
MKNDTRAILFGLAAVACWSTVATAFKFSLQHLTTQQLLFYATLTATFVLVVVAMVQQGGKTLLRSFQEHWQMTLIAGALNPVIYYEVLFRAYDLLPAQVAMSINYSWAIVLTAMAAIILKQKMKAVDFVAAFLCYTGVVIIATEGRLLSTGEFSLLGVILALASTVIWASYWIINMRDTRDPVIGLALNFLVALPVVAFNCWWFSSFTVTAAGIGSAVYVGVMEMALGFLFWSTALRLTSNASRVSNLIFLSPFLSLVFIYLILNEAIHPATLGGLVLIVGGLLGQQWQHALENQKSVPT